MPIALPVLLNTSSRLPSDRELASRFSKLKRKFPSVLVPTAAGPVPSPIIPFIITSMGRVHEESKAALVARFGDSTARLLVRASSMSCVQATSALAAAVVGDFVVSSPSPVASFKLLWTQSKPSIAVRLAAFFPEATLTKLVDDSVPGVDDDI